MKTSNVLHFRYLLIISTFIGVVFVVIAGYYFSKDSSKNSVISINSLEGIPDIYPGLEWAPAKRQEIAFSTQTMKDKVYQDGYRIVSIGLDYYPDHFVGCYNTQFKNRGWTKIAGSKGPGGTRFGYSVITNYTYIDPYGLGGVLTDGDEQIFEYGVMSPGWSEYPGQYQAYIQYNILSE